MATYNTVIKKRNAANNGWDSILPITTSENVLINEQGDTVATHMAEKATQENLGHVMEGHGTTIDEDGRISVQLEIVPVSENKILSLTDAFKVLNCNNSSNITITIPANDDVEFIVSTEIAIIRNGTGNVSVAPDTGVTLNSDGSKRKIKSQYASAALKKIDTDTWILVGSLTS